MDQLFVSYILLLRKGNNFNGKILILRYNIFFLFNWGIGRIISPLYPKNHQKGILIN
jgi:hypothetical protein